MQFFDFASPRRTTNSTSPPMVELPRIFIEEVYMHADVGIQDGDYLIHAFRLSTKSICE